MFAFSDEQRQLRETVRRFLTDNVTSKDIRDLMVAERGYNPKTYAIAIEQLGLGGIHVPEQFAGGGLSYIELCIVLEEMGRTLYPSPFLSSNVLAANALLLSGSDEQKARLLPDISTGRSILTVALYEQSNRKELGNFQQSVHSGRFSGTKLFVPDAIHADAFILVAPAESNANAPSFWFTNDLANIETTPVATIDTTRRLASMKFHDASVELLGDKTNSNQFERFMDLACVALANEMVGSAQHLLENSVAYTKERVQFGRTIGSMQSIKHKCADLLLEVELAKSAAYVAAASVAADDPDLGQHACIAKAAASDALMRAATDAVQLRGGIGFTWEDDTHLWFRRAKSSQVSFGDANQHRESFLARLRTKEEVAV